ncbi:MAG: UvrD-helicase domain-containing protein, partial [Magnetococcales bacterium]|nr:UvrD-helicase domain-containing protein [Magnetococcales bacterium]
GRVDHTEIALRAQQALGNPDQPTELALKLDYQIKHLLIDEFQDTSLGQNQLLERLTAGWSGEDGRTLFLVGDPMQSIYRFREAEVGLFMRTQAHGIGAIPIKNRSLSVNFRSTPAIIDWINHTFPTILGDQVDLVKGAVPFHRSDSFPISQNRASVSPDIKFFPMLGADYNLEAQRVAEWVQELLELHPEQNIAVLARSRSHLAEILPELKRQGIRFQALEIESLARRTVVVDLLALTRAMLHPADRVHWLAVLRAPWCGLDLADLLHLVESGPQWSIPDLLAQEERWRACLSHDGCMRLERFWAVVQPALMARRRMGLRSWIEGIWLALGGADGLSGAMDLDDALSYFELLEKSDQAGMIGDLEGFVLQAGKLYADADPEGDPRVQVMTIHKAKGLEFDAVILPGLGRPPRSASKRVLHWVEWSDRPWEESLLLDAIPRFDSSSSPVYDYLRELDREKSAHEARRLFYVAATRAKRRLLMFGHVKSPNSKGGSAPGDPKPAPNSLLSSMWDQVEPQFRTLQTVAHEEEGEDRGSEETQLATRRVIGRLPTDWQLPPMPEPTPLSIVLDEAPSDPPPPFEWAGESRRLIGIVTHRFFQRIAMEGPASWPSERIRSARALYASHLALMGLPTGKHRSDGPAELAAIEVEHALLRTLEDPTGRWILHSDHREANNEYGVTGRVNGRLRRVVLDRTFIDAKSGERWIIDYKTSVHGSTAMEAFLDQELERYKPQLDGYASLMRVMDPDRPIRLGLYFPMFPGWRSWRAFESEE